MTTEYYQDPITKQNIPFEWNKETPPTTGDINSLLEAFHGERQKEFGVIRTPESAPKPPLWMKGLKTVSPTLGKVASGEPFKEPMDIPMDLGFEALQAYGAGKVLAPVAGRVGEIIGVKNIPSLFPKTTEVVKKVVGTGVQSVKGLVEQGLPPWMKRDPIGFKTKASKVFERIASKEGVSKSLPSETGGVTLKGYEAGENLLNKALTKNYNQLLDEPGTIASIDKQSVIKTAQSLKGGKESGRLTDTARKQFEGDIDRIINEIPDNPKVYDLMETRSSLNNLYSSYLKQSEKGEEAIRSKYMADAYKAAKNAIEDQIMERGGSKYLAKLQHVDSINTKSEVLHNILKTAEKRPGVYDFKQVQKNVNSYSRQYLNSVFEKDELAFLEVMGDANKARLFIENHPKLMKTLIPITVTLTAAGVIKPPWHWLLYKTM